MKIGLVQVEVSAVSNRKEMYVQLWNDAETEIIANLRHDKLTLEQYQRAVRIQNALARMGEGK